MNRILGRTAALAVADAAVLLGLRPRWSFVAGGIRRPDAWLADPDVALAALCGVLLWLSAAWVAVGLLAGLGTRVPGWTGRACTRFARVLLPRVLVRVVIGSTGLGLLAAPAAHAMAPTSAPTGAVPARPVSTASAPAGSVWLPASPWTGEDVPSPTWPVSPVAVTPTPNPPLSPAGPDTRGGTRVLPAPVAPSTAPPTTAPPATGPAGHGTTAHVEHGDSLWLLAAHRLGPHADAQLIAHYWPQVYAANRSVIGDDPSVLRPGQVLDLPAPTQESSR